MFEVSNLSENECVSIIGCEVRGSGKTLLNWAFYKANIDD
jgi:hypothetical protein